MCAQYEAQPQCDLSFEHCDISFEGRGGRRISDIVLWSPSHFEFAHTGMPYVLYIELGSNDLSTTVDPCFLAKQLVSLGDYFVCGYGLALFTWGIVLGGSPHV